MGLTTGTLKNGSGQLLPNTLINFYYADGGDAAGSDETDSSGKYSINLAGPDQYRAKVGTVTCTPNPMNVLAGPVIINLIKP